MPWAGLCWRPHRSRRWRRGGTRSSGDDGGARLDSAVVPGEVVGRWAYPDAPEPRVELAVDNTTPTPGLPASMGYRLTPRREV
jgi:hypothetical protein